MTAGRASVTADVSRLRTGGELLAAAGPLADLLLDTVHAGASLGFLESLDRTGAAEFWRDQASAVDSGLLAVWMARDAGGVTGTIGVRFGDKPNGRHRAEIVKLMVHRRARGQGLGRTLLTAAEEGATRRGARLLHLDTETGSPAERLYRAAGWERAGTIPDYAADPYGKLHPTTLYYKRTGAAGVGGGAEAIAASAGAGAAVGGTDPGAPRGGSGARTGAPYA
ncbi:GNAT family N-acetyltransferase [Streptomyces uncialis]|uniref:GNAT family N-acetyltransferase n=1 Tax=Streptomyces uncialis TaxID=1048205 RepID=UPI003868E483|nr:GNAT family N-acetyltransferase [Streptomyces uncialis]